jgi:hypothetical protein
MGRVLEEVEHLHLGGKEATIHVEDLLDPSSTTGSGSLSLPQPLPPSAFGTSLLDFEMDLFWGACLLERVSYLGYLEIGTVS